MTSTAKIEGATSNRRIAYFSDGFFPFTMGGMAKSSTKLLVELVSRGWQVDIYGALPDASRVSEAETFLSSLESSPAALSPWPVLPNFPGHYAVENCRISAALWEKAKLQKYDLIFSHGFTSWSCLRTPHRERPPVIVHLHGLEMFQSSLSMGERIRSAPLRYMGRRILERADSVISFGKYFTDILTNKIGVAPDRIAVVPNAVDESFAAIGSPRERSDRHEGFRALYVGRYEARKQVEWILRLAEVFGETHFEIVGCMPESIIERSKRLTNVKLKAEIWDEQELVSAYRAADCLLLPSRSEGMPTVVLEAMAVGLPVLATAVGSVPELLATGAGRMVTGETFDDFANEFRKFIALPHEVRVAMGQKGQETVKAQYTWDKVGDTVSELVSGIIARNEP